MRLFNETPFKVKSRSAIVEPERHFLSVVIKGTFDMVPDGVCVPVPVDAQEKPTRALTYQDRIGNSRMTDSDVVPFKPRADCILLGTAHAPGGAATNAFDVTFGIGSTRKSLRIYGDRYWVRQANGDARLAGPEPVVNLPLRDEYAHGGLESKFNPHGRGFGTLSDVPGSRVQVANIMPAAGGAPAWHEDQAHAGFGVILPNCQPRRALAGTYDKAWAIHRRPLPPDDFDMAHFNAARTDQQIEGFLVGDEVVHAVHLHAEHAHYNTRLPGQVVRCFVNRSMDPHTPNDVEFAEVATVLDTCIVDMRRERVTLVWRGTLETISSRHERIQHLLVVSEKVGEHRAVPRYAKLLDEKLVDKRAQRAKERRKEKAEKAASLEKEGVAETLKLLRDGNADPALIAALEKQETLDGAEKVLLDWVDRFKNAVAGSSRSK